MSPIFLRTVYQICGISFGGDESRTWNRISASPGFE